MTTAVNAITVSNLTVRHGDMPVFEGLSTAFPKGRVTSIIGPNGAGKTTLLLAVLGLTKYSGEISFFKPRRELRLGYVPQKTALPAGSPMTVLDLFAVHIQKLPVFLGYTKECRETASRYLEQVGLPGRAGRKVSQLSGGELQRVMLAASLAQSPDIIILDEPASGVDFKGGRLFDDIIREANASSGMTVILVSHDLSAVNRNSDHVICLNKRMVCEGPPERTLTPESISAAFGNPALYHHHDDAEGK